MRDISHAVNTKLFVMGLASSKDLFPYLEVPSDMRGLGKKLNHWNIIYPNLPYAGVVRGSHYILSRIVQGEAPSWEAMTCYTIVQKRKDNSNNDNDNDNFFHFLLVLLIFLWLLNCKLSRYE